MKFHEDRCKGEAVMRLKPFYLTARVYRRTDGRTDGQGDSSIPPPNFVAGGIITAAAQIAYPNKFPTFPTKLIKYLLNLIEIYMYIGYRLGQRRRQTPVRVLELRSCGTSQRIQYYFKVNLVNF